MLEAKNLMRPIFVIGTGRCGLTPLMDLISYHNDLAWLSQYNNKFPNKMFLTYLSRIVELPIFNSSLKYSPIIPSHSEAFDYWSSLFLGFKEPFRDLNKHDVSRLVRNNFENAVKNFLNAININSKKYQAFINLSNVYILQNKIKKGVEILKKYLVENNYKINVINHLGIICLKYNYENDLKDLFK